MLSSQKVDTMFCVAGVLRDGESERHRGTSAATDYVSALLQPGRVNNKLRGE